CAEGDPAADGPRATNAAVAALASISGYAVAVSSGAARSTWTSSLSAGRFHIKDVIIRVWSYVAAAARDLYNAASSPSSGRSGVSPGTARRAANDGIAAGSAVSI